MHVHMYMLPCPGAPLTGCGACIYVQVPLSKGAVIDEEEMHHGTEMQSQGGKSGYAKAPR